MTVYVADTGNNRIQKFDSNGTFISKWGTTGNGDGEFWQPNTVAADSNGNVFVVDANNRIQKFDSNGTFISKWGTTGSGDGEFNNPSGIGVDGSGNVYVLDNGNFRIQKFDNNGTYITQWGQYGVADGEMGYPQTITVTPSGHVFFSQYATNRIQEFDSNGTFITKWGTGGSGNGQFSNPWGMAVDSSGNIYVGEHENSRIQKFDSAHNYVAQWGWNPTANGQFSTPRGVATDSSGNVYVADYYNSRIQKFNSSGTFITKWGSGGNGDGQFNFVTGIVTDAFDNVYVVDTQNARIQKFDSNGTFITKWGSYGTANGQFETPDGIATDSANNVYVTDSVTHRVQKFDSSGNFLTMWGDRGHGDNQLYDPEGIAIDGSDNVYVADTGSSRVKKFDSNGTFITKWGSAGVNSGQYNGLKDLVFDSQDNVYVVDSFNQRIQKYTPGTNSGAFTKVVSGLSCGTTYHYRAYATNTDGTSFGDNATFTTLDCPTAPTVTTGSIGDVQSDYASVYIDITSNGGDAITSYGVDYGTTTAYDQTSGNNNDASGEQQISLSGLTCGTAYHYRAYANNSVGSSHGDDATFTTAQCPQPYDLRLKASLVNTDPVKAGDTANYQLKAKNLGPGSSPVVLFYINIPTETTFSSATVITPNGHQGGCEDAGPIAEVFDSGPGGGINVTPYTGNLVACFIGVEGGLSLNEEVIVNLDLTATSDFKIGETVLRALAFVDEGSEVDMPDYTAAIFSGEPFYSPNINNIANLVYGQGDSDGDGIYDNVENAAPNSGDANNDGTPDSAQSNVTSLVDPVTGKYAVLAVDSQCEVTDITIRAESANTSQDRSNDYPNGMMDFTLGCGTPGYTANISQYYYGTSKDGFSLRKYNPTTKTYTAVDSASISERTIDNQTVTTATYQVKDGSSLDLDGIEDGNIHDPAGLARKAGLAGTGQDVITALYIGAALSMLGGGIFAFRGLRNKNRSSYRALL